MFGAPAGDQAIAVAPGPNGTTAFASPRLRIWQWPDGPFNETRPDVDEAGTLIRTVARPELLQVQAVRFIMHVHHACLLQLLFHKRDREQQLGARDAVTTAVAGNGGHSKAPEMWIHACVRMAASLERRS